MRHIHRLCMPLAAALTAGLVVAQTPAPAPSPTGLRIVVLEGEGAINNIREQRAKEPVVRVTDAEFRPIAGASVTFLTMTLGPSATFPRGNVLTVATDAKGEAVGRGLRPNNVAGPFQIRVTAAWRGLTASALINQVNAAPAAVRKKSSRTALVVLILGGGAAAGATLALTRKQAASPGPSPTPSAPPTTITAGSGSFGRP